MRKQYVGLNTYLYTFPLKQKENHDKVLKRLKSSCTITEVFVNNMLAFEAKMNRRVY